MQCGKGNPHRFLSPTYVDPSRSKLLNKPVLQVRIERTELGEISAENRTVFLGWGALEFLGTATAGTFTRDLRHSRLARPRGKARPRRRRPGRLCLSPPGGNHLRGRFQR